MRRTWAACNSMLLTHNWWHLALYYLEQGDWQTTLTLYDTCVWGYARTQRRIWLEVAVPTAQGLIAHGQEDRLAAIARLKPVMHRLQSAGGSHTQRALF